jgi:hypothetical protein
MRSPIPHALLVIQNYYRFELPDMFPRRQSRTTWQNSASAYNRHLENNFRGQKELSIASLLPDAIAELEVSREQDHSLNLKGQGEGFRCPILAEAYDQDRRIQKPKRGVALRIKRNVLDAYLADRGFAVFYDFRSSGQLTSIVRRKRWTGIASGASIHQYDICMSEGH